MKENYTWVSVYEKIADKVLEFKNNRKELLRIMYQMLEENGKFNDKDTKNCNLDSFKGERVKYDDIDPFSFLNRFDIRYSEKTRLGLMKAFIEKTKLDIEMPKDLNGIPDVNPQNTALIAFKDERKENDIDDFWNFYEVALAYADGNTYLKEEFINLYNNLLKKKYVKWNLTISLFKIRPNFYINLDSTNREFFKREFKIKFKDTPYTGEEYLNLLDELKQIIDRSDEYGSMVDFSHKAWEYSIGEKEETLKKIKWHGISYNPGFTVQDWLKLLNNKDIFDIDSLKMMKRFLDYGKEATCKQLSIEYGNTPWFYNGKAVGLGKRIQKATGIKFPKYTSEDEEREINQSWPILFLGRATTKNEEGVFSWKLRDELKDALEQMDLSDIPLYDEYKGNEASNIVDGNEIINVFLKKQGMNASGIYNFKTKELEVFEGSTYRATQTQSMPPRYKQLLIELLEDEVLLDGIFTKNYIFSRPSPAASIVLNRSASTIEWTDKNGKDLKSLIDKYNKPREIRIIEEEKINLEHIFLDDKYIEEILEILEQKKNIILQGVPGVGKTFVIQSILKSKYKITEENFQMVQFHQSYSYEEFIEGLRPNASGVYEIKDGKFKQFVQRAEEDPDNQYFFIIDEINRGNLSKILGELLMLIENDKREKEVNLAYSNEVFSVPKNLYIIGTMNITDRSLSLVDYALRRRFSFFTLKPAFNTSKFNKYMKKELNFKEVELDEINRKMDEINKKIKDKINESFEIGHSYFIKKEKNRNPDFKMFLTQIFKYEIIPLLEEYFFDEPETIKEFRTIMEIDG